MAEGRFRWYVALRLVISLLRRRVICHQFLYRYIL
jgi:hypothetical protein